jgi:hypothetical protein
MPVISLNPPPRRYRIIVEHHHDGRITLVLVGIPDGQATRATLRAILRQAIAAIEDGDGL